MIRCKFPFARGGFETPKFVVYSLSQIEVGKDAEHGDEVNVAQVQNPEARSLATRGRLHFEFCIGITEHGSHLRKLQ